MYPNVRMPFPITCTACQKAFSIADDVYERKVKGRVVTIKCKQCQAGIRVDGTKDTPVFSAAETESATPPAVVNAAPAAPEVPPPPAVQPPPEAPEPTKVVVAPTAKPEPDLAAPKAAPSAVSKPEPVAAEPKAELITKAAPKTEPIAKAAPLTAPKAEPIAKAAPLAAPKAEPAVKAAPAVVTPKAEPAAVSPKIAATAKAVTATATKTVTAAQPAATTATKAAPVAVTSKASAVAATPKATTSPAAKAEPAAKSEPLATKAPLAAARAPLGSAPRVPLTAGKQPGAALASKAAAPAVGSPLTPKPAATAAAPVPVPVPAAPGPAAPPAVVAVPPAATGAAEILWAVDYPDGEDRELTLAEISKELASGAVSASSLVWRDGMAEWLELGQVPELQKLIAAPAATPPAATPPAAPAAAMGSAPAAAPPPPARAKMASAPAVDPPKPPPPGARPRPAAPSVPVIDFAMPAAPNPTPQPLIPRSPTMSGIGSMPTPATSFDAAAFPAAPSFPAAPVMVPAPALAAPFATQSFARQQVPSPVGASSPTANIPDWPEKKSRAPLIIGILVLLLVIGGAIVFLTRSDDKLPPMPPISALPATAPTKTPSAPPTATATDTAESQASGPGSRAALQPPNSGPTATPNAGFAELFANGARRADDKGGAPGQHFDVNAANKALASASVDTAQCREKGGPSGKATVAVTFEPSGKVVSATVSDAPFAGTSSGACIATTLKRATVPPFSGLPGTVTKIIYLQ